MPPLPCIRQFSRPSDLDTTVGDRFPFSTFGNPEDLSGSRIRRMIAAGNPCVTSLRTIEKGMFESSSRIPKASSIAPQRNMSVLMEPAEPVNEIVRTYAPGTPERESLKPFLKEISSSSIEIPLRIGGRDVRTGNTTSVVMPHAHRHVLATWHKRRHGSGAGQYARQRMRIGNGLPGIRRPYGDFPSSGRPAEYVVAEHPEWRDDAESEQDRAPAESTPHAK